MKKDELMIGKLSLLFSMLFISINFISGAIVIVSPANSTNFTGTAFFNVTYVNVTDGITNAVNATFYYNSSSGWTKIGNLTCNNQTNLSCSGNLNISSITEGKYNVNVTLDNGTAQVYSTSLSYNVNFDSTPPNISLIAPTDGTQGTEVVTFIFNVSDASKIINCSLNYQSGIFSTITNVINGINQIEVTSLTDQSPLYMNDLQWYISCTDELSNKGISLTRNLDTIPAVIYYGGSTTTENLNPKYVNIVYPKEWERGSSVTVKIQSYNTNDELYTPEKINFILDTNGISFEKFLEPENGTIVATFKILDSTELGNKTIGVTITDERINNQQMDFSVIANSGISQKISGNIFGVENEVIYLVGGGIILLVFLMLIIIAVVSGSGKKKDNSNN